MKSCDSRRTDADANDFVGDGVAVRTLLRRRRGGEPASLLEVDGIGRAGDFGMALILNTEVDSPADAVNGMLKSILSCVIHAGRGTRFTCPVHVDASFRCAFDAVDVPV